MKKLLLLFLYLLVSCNSSKIPPLPPNQNPEFIFLGEETYNCGKISNTVKEYLHKKTSLEFVLIPAGKFLMGSDIGDKDEQPVHWVKVSSFLISKTEVTQKAWYKIMKTRPCLGKKYVKNGDDYPVSYVNWNDCQEFCLKSNLALPTEAQWEYACRAKTTTNYYWGDKMDKRYCWYKLNAWDHHERYQRKVAKKRPNGFGLYDMLGNVEEFCLDYYQYKYENQYKKNPTGPKFGFMRVLRGGGTHHNARTCRSSERVPFTPTKCNYDVGFRVVYNFKTFSKK